jgi:hypothetical protein
MLIGGVEQEWAARFNGVANQLDEAVDLVVDDNGNAYVTGYCDWELGGQTNDVYTTIMYDANGIQQWVSLYDGNGGGNDQPSSLAMDQHGNVFVTGRSIGIGTHYDYATVKYNAAGIQQWVTRYNGLGDDWDETTCLTVDTSGNVYVTGYSLGIGTDFDYITIKYNSIGDQQWIACYNWQGDDDKATSLAVNQSGNVYITGFSWGSGTYYDFATVKYDTAGNQEWVSRYNGLGNYDDQAFDLAVDQDGNVIVTGPGWGNETLSDYTTIKYNQEGDILWLRNYNGIANGQDVPSSLVIDQAGNVYVTGCSYGGSGSGSYATVKYNSVGDQLWVACYNSSEDSNDEPYDIILDVEGSVYVTGDCWFTAVRDYLSIKYSESGVQQWLVRYNGPGNMDDVARGLGIDANGSVYVTGYSYVGGNHYDYATIKYSQPAIPNWQPVTSTYFGTPQPQQCRLKSPHPNPFNPTTAISYELRASSYVNLKVYDTAGRLVTKLVDGWREAGAHEVTFDGSGLAAGVYFLRFEASGSGTTPTAMSQKILLVK